jgi:RNAse (barnase) inhibitor barstar
VNELTNEPYTVVYDSDKNFVIAFKSFLSTKNISLHFIEIDPNQIVNDNELYDQTFGFLAFRDEETNSTWNLLGSAVRGPLKGIFSFMHFKNNYILICPLLLIYSCLC